MKKFTVLAAALLVAGAAMAAGPVQNLNADRLFVQPNATPFLSGGPATINNDDSCDIAVTPAATLLLPYFEVNIAAQPNEAVNTIFTITNVSSVPQIAHITVWTDWSFPVLDFNIYLTGYDVQGLSLYDILARGVIPETGYDLSPQGALSEDWNDKFLESAEDNCAELPGPIPTSLLTQVQNALTKGTYFSCAAAVGGVHTNAIGYITVDVAADCTQKLPTDADYFSNEILWDNVFIGDYQRLNPTSTTGNYAGGNPMVHIRAIPEDGFAGEDSGRDTNFDFTFYDRYTPTSNREADRRQPLPGVWAARFVQGGAGSFNTNVVMWREGNANLRGSAPACATAPTSNRTIPITRITRFDESENPTVGGGCQVSPCPAETTFTAPETSASSTSNTSQFPADNNATGDLGGWLYLNLNSGVSTNLTDRGSPARSQNWVTLQMTAEGRYGVDFDAAYLGNGCSSNPGSGAIGPQANSAPSVDSVD